MTALRLLLVLCAMVLVACGDDEDSASTSSAATATASADSCTPDQLQTQQDGTLTVGTDKPAFPPYFVDDDPTNGKGFESAVAYAKLTNGRSSTVGRSRCRTRRPVR